MFLSTEKYVKKLLFSTEVSQANYVSLLSMSVISLTKLYDLLTSKLGKETAENLTTFIVEKIDDEVENKTQRLATKEDVAIAKVDLKEDLANTKVDLIKWIFALWVTLALMIIGLYLKK